MIVTVASGAYRGYSHRRLRSVALGKAAQPKKACRRKLGVQERRGYARLRSLATSHQGDVDVDWEQQGSASEWEACTCAETVSRAVTGQAIVLCGMLSSHEQPRAS